MPKHCRSDKWEFAKNVVQITVADASGRHADEYFPVLRWINFDLIDFQRLAWLHKHCCSCTHVPTLSPGYPLRAIVSHDQVTMYILVLPFRTTCLTLLGIDHLESHS